MPQVNAVQQQGNVYDVGSTAVDVMAQSFFTTPAPLNANQVKTLGLEAKLGDPYSAKVNASPYPPQDIGRVAIIAGSTIYARQDGGAKPGWYAVGPAPRGATTNAMSQAQSDAVALSAAAFFDRAPVSDQTISFYKLNDALTGDTPRWNESPYPPDKDPANVVARVAVQVQDRIYLQQTIGNGKPTWYFLGPKPQ